MARFRLLSVKHHRVKAYDSIYSAVEFIARSGVKKTELLTDGPFIDGYASIM